MANGGWYGTKKEWERIENPLLQVDSILDDFAQETGMSMTKNHKDWPERSFEWGSDTRCLIQLFLVDASDLIFNLWLCASQDRGRERFWKQDTPIKEQRVEQFRDSLAGELRKGHQRVVEWGNNPDNLEFVRELE